MTCWTVTLYVDVNDEAELWDAAIAHAYAERGEGHRPSDDEDFGTRESPNVGNCLRQLTDPGISWPGTSILDSSAE